MTDDKERLLADLEAIAASIQDPAKRQEVQRIIARLSHQAQEWPDDAEMMHLRLKCSETDD
jgi:cytochrome c-type biogenesis protein CcmH/NrfG